MIKQVAISGYLSYPALPKTGRSYRDWPGGHWCECEVVGAFEPVGLVHGNETLLAYRAVTTGTITANQAGFSSAIVTTVEAGDIVHRHRIDFPVDTRVADAPPAGKWRSAIEAV